MKNSVIMNPKLDIAIMKMDNNKYFTELKYVTKWSCSIFRFIIIHNHYIVITDLFQEHCGWKILEMKSNAYKVYMGYTTNLYYKIYCQFVYIYWYTRYSLLNTNI